MKMKFAVTALCLMSFWGSAAFAAEPNKVAIANPGRIFSEMQELKDLRGKMDSEKKLLEGVDREKREHVRAIEAARDALKVETLQYQEKNAELLKVTIEYETWGRLNNANFQREQKLQLKLLYQKIEEAVAEVAKQKGYDLVISDQRSEMPAEIDRLNIEQLRVIINSRAVLYSGEKADISNDVLALLDAKYRGTSKSEK